MFLWKFSFVVLDLISAIVAKRLAQNDLYFVQLDIEQLLSQLIFMLGPSWSNSGKKVIWAKTESSK